MHGPCITRAYFGDHTQVVDADGFLDTGDVATMDALGYMQLTDRSKTVIKSGGEWISSTELENPVVAHPQVVEAAAVAVPHPKWGERPLLVGVLKEGESPVARGHPGLHARQGRVLVAARRRHRDGQNSAPGDRQDPEDDVA